MKTRRLRRQRIRVVLDNPRRCWRRVRTVATFTIPAGALEPEQGLSISYTREGWEWMAR